MDVMENGTAEKFFKNEHGLGYIGIDPGKNGAIAAIRANGTPFDHAVFDRKKFIEIVDRCTCYFEHVHVILERVSAMPGQGSVSMFHFGENFGWIQGVLDSSYVPYELVLPRKWKKEFGCTSDKNTSVEVARRLFPGVDFRRTEKCVKPHDGLAEAYLMAEYARRAHHG